MTSDENDNKEYYNKMVSIITPVYNCERFIEDAIISVQKQSYKNWEILIVDDASTDCSSDIVKSLMEKDSRIKYYKFEKNLGPAKARNEAIRKASGQYIAFLDSDDTWVPEKLEKQIYFMESKNSTMSFTSYSFYTENKIPLKKKAFAPAVITYKELIKYNWIGTSTLIYNAEVLGKHFMPNIRNRQDWGLWLVLIKIAGYANFINEPLARYTVRKNSISSKKLRLISFHWNIYRKCEKFSFLKSVLFLFINIIFHLINKKVVEE
jgi:hypothetical protein